MILIVSANAREFSGRDRLMARLLLVIVVEAEEFATTEAFLSSQRKDIPVSMVSRGNDFEQMRTIECHLLE